MSGHHYLTPDGEGSNKSHSLTYKPCERAYMYNWSMFKTLMIHISHSKVYAKHEYFTG